MTTMVETAIYRMKVEGKDSIDAAAKSVDGLSVSEERATKATRTTQQSFARWQASLDPAIRAHQAYQAALEKGERFAAAGIGSEQERAHAIAMATQRYQQATGALNRHGAAANDNAKKIGLTSREMKNLGFQVNDVATMLAMGSSPFQILASQSGQVLQILQGANGGVTGAIKGMAASVVAFLGPLGLFAAGIAAAAAAAYGFYSLLKTQAPTAEKLLSEHDRLLKIVKDSYDKTTNAARNWYNESKNVTMLQLLQQEIGLREKLTEATIKGLKSTVEIPIGGSIARIKDEYKAFSESIYTLNEGWQKGTPDVKAFVDEVARIALLNPAIQKLGADLAASMGDANKFSTTLQQTRDLLKGLKDGTFDKDQRDRLGLGGGTSSINAYDQLIQRTEDRIEQLELEGKTAGQTGNAVQALRLQHDAELAARKAGVSLNQEYLDSLKQRLAAADRLAKLGNIRADIKFERDTMFLSEQDVQIATRLHKAYDSIGEALSSNEARALRFNAKLVPTNDNEQKQDEETERKAA